MSLLAPWALWFFAVGGAVVALYLLKIKRQRQTVPALDFWLQLMGQVRARSLFQRLKRWMSLLLWLVITTCLVLAVGNPVVTLGRVKPQSIVVVFDNSASMQTVENAASKQTRFAQARAALEEMLDGRPVDDEWMLIEAARRPAVRQAWTRDRRTIREAAAAIAPHEGTGDLKAARDLASELLAGKPEPLIVILTDGAAGQATELAASDDRVIVRAVGKAEDNLGITRLAVRQNRQLSTHHALVSVLNASPSEMQSQIVLEIDGVTTAVEPFTLAAGATLERSLTLPAGDGGVLRASIDRADAFPADNEAFAILQPMKPAHALLVSDPKDAFFFEQALTAMEPLIDAAEGRTMTIEEYDAADATRNSADLTIFNNVAPKALPPAGAFICINRWPDTLGAKIAGEIKQPAMVVARRDHPLMQYVTLGGASLAAAQEVTLSDRATVLVESDAQAPLVFLLQQPDRQVLCLAFDVLASDLPVRNAFPVMLRNAVVHLVWQQRAWLRDQYAVGETIEPQRTIPEGVTQVAVAREGEAPAEPNRGGAAKRGGQTSGLSTLPVRNGAFRFDATQQRGPLRFTIGDENAFTVVNLTDERESRIAPPTGLPDPSARLALTGRLFGTLPWLALAIAATVLVGLEWLTYHHRWTE